MLKLVHSLTLIICLSGFLNAQDYWQQEVNQVIDARLNPVTNFLSGKSTITYFNNSPDTLQSIIFHFWANAYSDRISAYGKQLLGMADREFYFATDAELGGYTDITFRQDDQILMLKGVNNHVDVAEVLLADNLEPGQKVILQCDFDLVIPKMFSRMGRQDGGAHLTQWYPKPAVYDKDGWHPMPYLNIGEYYSEFGTTEYSITLPSEYIIAGTGAMLDEEERAKYIAMAKKKSPYPESSGSKTITFRAENVHDVAFCVDKNFRIDHDVLHINNQNIDCWIFSRPEASDSWNKANSYLKRALQFYSEEIAPYPYPQATVVEGGTVGGGMEYPMLTVINDEDDGPTLDEIIAHEVGHNWFYGILASNERDHPWIDEGFNSYIEKEYMEKFYDGSDGLNLNILGGGDTKVSLERLALKFQMDRGYDQEGNLKSEEYNTLNYGLMAYFKPAVALQYWRAYIGDSTAKMVMRELYDQWKFKHLSPTDLQLSMEKSTGQELNWLFQGLLLSNKRADYAITKVSKENSTFQVNVKNCGEVPMPIRLQLAKGDSVIYEEWHAGFSGNKSFDLPMLDADWISTDFFEESLDLNAENNHYRLNKILPKLGKPKVRFVPGFDSGKESTIYLYPEFGWNNYDGFMTGLHWSNTGIVPEKFLGHFHTLYGFRSSEIVGYGHFSYNHILRQGLIRKIQIGAGYKKYSFADNSDLGYTLNYQKWSPGIRLFLRGKANRLERSELHFTWERIITESPIIRDNQLTGKEHIIDNWLVAGYDYQKMGTLHPVQFSFESRFLPYTIELGNVEQNEHLWRIESSLIKDFYYKAQKKFRMRVYAGYFITNTRRDAGSVLSPLAKGSLGLSYQGHHDLFEHTFLGRTEQEGLLSRQVLIKQGGFKNAFTSPYKNVIANSNSLVLSINTVLDLPIKWPVVRLIKPYFDIGYYEDRQPSSNLNFGEQILWSGGLALDFRDGLFGVYLPLLNSDRINEVYDLLGQKNPFQRISFSIDLMKISPYELAQRIEVAP